MGLGSGLRKGRGQVNVIRISYRLTKFRGGPGKSTVGREWLSPPIEAFVEILRGGEDRLVRFCLGSKKALMILVKTSRAVDNRGQKRERGGKKGSKGLLSVVFRPKSNLRGGRKLRGGRLQAGT